MRAALLALACSGCIPAVPFVVGETAETLKPREVSAAIYGGGGAFVGTAQPTAACCGGVMARVRVGIGHAQEVGVEGGTYLEGRPGNGNVWGTGKLVWKLQWREHVAIIAGIGTTFLGTVGIGGDAGVIVSTSPWRDQVRLYAALRGTMMVESDGGLSDGGGVLTAGVAWDVSRRLRLAAEIGAVGSGNYVPHPIDFEPRNSGWFGGYGAAVVSYASRR
jgi:hypothetical protein